MGAKLLLVVLLQMFQRHADGGSSDAGLQACQQRRFRLRAEVEGGGAAAARRVSVTGVCPRSRKYASCRSGLKVRAQPGPRYSAAEAALSQKQPGPHCSAAEAASCAVLLRERHLLGAARRGTARGGSATMRRRPEPGWQRVMRARVSVPRCSQRDLCCSAAKGA